jgi:ABC-2 type transport system ATP-binding protein
VARQIFYDRLVEDYSRHPRTIILSSHLIDEVANLLEHVILIDKGRIILDDDAESIRGSAVTVTGETTKVTDFTAGRTVLHREGLESLASVAIEARLGSEDRALAADLGLELSPVSWRGPLHSPMRSGSSSRTTTANRSTRVPPRLSSGTSWRWASRPSP